jgi:hypothetical protein
LAGGATVGTNKIRHNSMAILAKYVLNRKP